MYLAMHDWMRPEPLERTARRLAGLGFEGLELYARPDLPPAPEVRRILAEHGITCWGVAVPSRPGDLIAEAEQERSAWIAHAIGCVHLCAELGGQIVCIVPSASGPKPSAVAATTEWRWAVEGLTEVHDDAHRLGVRLALEPCNRFETYFTFQADEALALARAVGPSCGLALDTFHLNIEEDDPFETILRVGDRVFDFHVADTNRLACGMGHWDWPRTIDVLRRVGYDGGLALEFIPARHRTPPAITIDSVETEVLHGSEGALSEEAYSMLMRRSAATLRPLLETTGSGGESAGPAVDDHCGKERR